MKKYVSAAVASEILGVHPVTLRRWAGSGLIESIKVGQHGKRRYSVDALIESNRAKEVTKKDGRST